jgi:glycosyltransferase involved in cell wall biosynthesis
MITKFPPIQGGISSKSYWLARGLVELGVKIHVVTNANCVETEYRIAGCDDHLSNLNSIRIHGLSNDIPWHIPFSTDYTTRLLNQVLKVIGEHNIQIIDAGFIVPYGIVAFLASKLTGLPYILRHGGSDVEKFFRNYEYSYVIKEAITNANAIVTHDPSIFRDLNDNIFVITSYIPNSSAFEPFPNQKINSKSEMVYLGKINYYWSNKELLQLLNRAKTDYPNYKIVFYAQGIGLNDFIKQVNKNKLSIEIRPFIPPWEVPTIMSNFGVVMVSHDQQIPSISNVLLEAVAMKKGILTLHEDEMKSANVVMKENTYEQWIESNYKLLNHMLSNASRTKDGMPGY